MNIVYRITNNTTKKCYIGMTCKTLKKRWSSHKHVAKYFIRNNHFSNAIRKYGPEDWKLEVLHELDSYQETKNVEIMCIDKYDTFNNGYNSTIGGDGWPHTDATKLKISIANKGRKRTKEFCERMKQIQFARKGWKHTLEARAKMSLAGFKKNHMRGKHGKDHGRSIPVTLGGALYESITDAANAIGLSRTTIRTLVGQGY